MIRKLLKKLFAVEPRLLITAAGLSTLVGLAFMVLPIFAPIPLLLVAGMSFSHVFGLLGILLFAASVLQEVLLADRGKAAARSSLNPPTEYKK